MRLHKQSYFLSEVTRGFCLLFWSFGEFIFELMPSQSKVILIDQRGSKVKAGI